LLKPVVEQPQYNLFVRERFEVEYERVFDKLQLGSTVWSPLAQGILTGKYNESLGAEGRLTALADNPALRSVMQRFFATEETKAQTQDKLKRLGEIAKELGAT
jgi:aryl-alcohol dehydrogenase-like predicted oxidoreductase